MSYEEFSKKVLEMYHIGNFKTLAIARILDVPREEVLAVLEKDAGNPTEAWGG